MRDSSVTADALTPQREREGDGISSGTTREVRILRGFHITRFAGYPYSTVVELSAHAHQPALLASP